MSGKELRRAGVLARVKSGELKLGNAAVMMGLSYRQSKRLAKRYREEGAHGLKHGSAGQESNRKKRGNSGNECCGYWGRSILAGFLDQTLTADH
jgi:transposase